MSKNSDIDQLQAVRLLLIEATGRLIDRIRSVPPTRMNRRRWDAVMRLARCARDHQSVIDCCYDTAFVEEMGLNDLPKAVLERAASIGIEGTQSWGEQTMIALAEQLLKERIPSIPNF
jgi:hypothetical protein